MALFGEQYNGWTLTGIGALITAALGAIGLLISRERSSRVKMKERQAQLDIALHESDAEVEEKRMKAQLARDKAEQKQKQDYVDYLIKQWEAFAVAAAERERNCQLELAAVKTDLASLQGEVMTLRARLEKAGL